MPEDLNARYRRVLHAQLEMNPGTWNALQDRGVTESTKLRLDFSFVADDLKSGEALKAILEEQTDYDIGVGTDNGKCWIVSGSTQPTAVSLAILDQWVDWMVTAGVHRGCDFDGWGAAA